MYLVMLVSKFLSLMIFGFESGCLGLENQAFGFRHFTKKTTFAEVGILIILGFIFHDFLLAWRLAWNLMDFRVVLGSPLISGPLWWKVNWLVPGA